MKKLAFFVITLGLSLSSQAQIDFGSAPKSKILTELDKKQTTHSVESWELESTKGINKVNLVIEAVKYTSQDGSNEQKGIKMILIPEYINTDNELALSSKELVSYIDNSEYPEIIVVLNTMLNDYRKKEDNNSHGSMTYITEGNIKIGFVQTEQKEIAYLSILYSKAEVICEFSDIDDFLSELKNYIDVASKELYLPENVEKLRKAKKSNHEAKDVIINDI
ncbi:MAG: hypothetical protein PF517_20790 [Salinivirgaceae bacterium]|jgi:hypothetical protein|nr:hypothetical protein [Salinivirgaceae bacterium]